MGRAEKRRLERQERIARKKTQVTMDRREVNEMKKNITQQATEYGVDALMTCFGLAQHRLFGFGRKRVLRTLQYIDDMMRPVVEGTISIEDYKRILEEEVHIVIK